MRRSAAATLAVLVAASLALAGCSGRQTLTQWASSSGVTGLDSTLVADVHDVLGAEKAGKSPNEISTICDALYQDANQAYDSDLPSPDGQLNTELGAAYVDLINGSQTCSEVVGGSDAASTAAAYATIRKGEVELNTATEDLAGLGVRS